MGKVVGKVTKARSLEYTFARFQLDTRPSLAIFTDIKSRDNITFSQLVLLKLFYNVIIVKPQSQILYQNFFVLGAFGRNFCCAKPYAKLYVGCR